MKNCLAAWLLIPFMTFQWSVAQEPFQLVSSRGVPLNSDDSPGFRNEVLPVLSKLGCNSGPCHGALAGKGGFRLSLRGFDPAADHFNIVKQAKGRRIEFRDPAKSLLLTKPTGAVPHKGGVRLDVDSEAYQILSSWIAAGAESPSAEDKKLEKIEFSKVNVDPSNQQNELKVKAIFTDGTVRDVTRWAKFTSTDETIAKVTDDGDVQIVGHGEGAVTAWYDSRIAVAKLTIPYPNQIDPKIFQKG